MAQTQVHRNSAFEDKIAALIERMAEAGYPVVRTSGKRTVEQQAKLYAKGRTAPGDIVTEKSGKPGDESRHQLDMARDFAFVGANGQPSYSEKHPWKLLGDTAKSVGLEWGGDWESLVDRPHVQQPNLLEFRKGDSANGYTDPSSVKIGRNASQPATPPSMFGRGTAEAATRPVLSDFVSAVSGLKKDDDTSEPSSFLSPSQRLLHRTTDIELTVPKAEVEDTSEPASMSSGRRRTTDIELTDKTPRNAKGWTDPSSVRLSGQPPTSPNQTPTVTARREITPAEFAQQLGGTITAASAAPSAQAAQSQVSPEDFAKSLGGTVSPFNAANGLTDSVSNKDTQIESNTGWDQFWRGMYSFIPDVAGMIGGAVGGTYGAATGAAGGAVTGFGFGALPGAATGAFIGAHAGANAGGIAGRGIQHGIDVALDRPESQRNPRGYGDEGMNQMAFEGAGRVFSGLLSRYKGIFAPATQEAADRMATNKDFKLGLSVGDISGDPTARRLERGAGVISNVAHAQQRNAQARTDTATQKVIGSILDSVGPKTGSTEAGELAQGFVKDAAGVAERQLQATATRQLAPKTGLGATGEIAEAGVQAGRTAFARQSKIYGDIVKGSPDVDMTPLHEEAKRYLRDEILPVMEQIPTLGPKTGAFKQLVAAYRKAATTGERVEMLTPAMQKALSEAAAESNYAPLKVINQALATPKSMTFDAAVKLRSLLRGAGKQGDLLAGSEAEGLAQYLETGSRISGEEGWTGLRGMLNKTSPTYEAAAEAFAANRELFESTLVTKTVESNPEDVLMTLTNAQGRYNASRIQQIKKVLTDLPREFGSKEEVAAGEKAWNTLRSEWFRREIVQDNVFGMSERMGKVDADVLSTWFPDLAGKDVIRQAKVTASAFESQLLAQISEADPSKVVDMIGASPKRVQEFVTRINGLPGPVRKDAIVDGVRRAWTEEKLIGGDVSKLSQRISAQDPKLLETWFNTPKLQEALTGLKRVGQALESRQVSSNAGMYRGVGPTGIVSAIAYGHPATALVPLIGAEGIPSFVMWAAYNPSAQKFLMEAAAPNASVTSKTAALLHVVGAFQSEQKAQARQQQQ